MDEFKTLQEDIGDGEDSMTLFKCLTCGHIFLAVRARLCPKHNLDKKEEVYDSNE